MLEGLFYLVKFLVTTYPTIDDYVHRLMGLSPSGHADEALLPVFLLGGGERLSCACSATRRACHFWF
jgi:hypothetical protein